MERMQDSVAVQEIMKTVPKVAVTMFCGNEEGVEGGFVTNAMVSDTPFLQQCGVEDLILRVGGETSWSNTCA